MNKGLTLATKINSTEKKNKLISDLVKKHEKIENFKKEIEEIHNKIDYLKKIFKKNTSDILVDFKKTKKKFIIHLIEKSKHKSLTKWQKEILTNIIEDEFYTLESVFCMDEELAKIRIDFHNEIYNNFNKSEKNIAKNMFDIFKEEMDLPEDFDISRINDPEYMEEMRAKIHENFFEQEKLQKQNENFENQQNIDLDFKQIYRKLVRFCHPDLMKTTNEKNEMDIYIKRINIAWEEQNYYELIIIWMEIDPENKLNIELNEANCKKMIIHFNSTLANLEAEKYHITRRNPETAFFYQSFNAKLDKTIIKKVDKYKNLLEKSIIQTELKNDDIKTINGLKKVLEFLYDED